MHCFYGKIYAFAHAENQRTLLAQFMAYPMEDATQVLFSEATVQKELQQMLQQNPDSLAPMVTHTADAFTVRPGSLLDKVLQVIAMRKMALTDLEKVDVLFTLLRAYHPITAQHSSNVKKQAIILVQQINEDTSFTYYKISAEELRSLIISALGHDTGKIGVLLETINKKGPLVTEERKQMSAHPEMTKFLFDSVSIQDLHARDAAHYHHRKADQVDSLYPRIISVLDVFEALTSPLREYRTPLKAKEIKTELAIRAEKNELDPVLVRYIIGDILLIEQLHDTAQQRDVLP